MKKTTRPPRFLPEVLQAIYELKETGGSNSNKIVTHVKSSLHHNDSFPAPRNLSTQVRRALNHATTNGIVKQRAGKFRINIGILDPFKDCAECRRRKRMQKTKKRRRRRRGRHHAVLPVRAHRHHGSDSESLRFSDSDSDFPVKQLRRRRRKGGEKKRRRRRRRRSAGDRENRGEEKRGDDLNPYPDDHKDGDENMDDNRQCDNPDCLCNVKEEIEEIQNMDPPM
ncbi:uncharacterized protein LOC135140956 isoform X2 [Zophobas morio]|uniref:uncharacterized protein LOC135140956 isoform X2 n=1 Tax=Zophobas morio TaxID=2755281 RepID=UPI0030839D64